MIASWPDRRAGSGVFVLFKLSQHQPRIPDMAPDGARARDFIAFRMGHEPIPKVAENLGLGSRKSNAGERRMQCFLWPPRARPAHLPHSKPTTINPGNSRHERGTRGGQVTRKSPHPVQADRTTFPNARPRYPLSDAEHHRLPRGCCVPTRHRRCGTVETCRSCFSRQLADRRRVTRHNPPHRNWTSGV